MVVLKSTDFDAAIFDLDGTMVDNSSYHERSWREFLARYGKTLTHDEFQEHIFGKHNHDIIKHLFGDVSRKREIALGNEKERMYREAYRNKMVAVGGLREFLTALAKFEKKTAVATSAPVENRTMTLEALGLDSFFSALLGPEDIRHPKPAPDMYLEAARRMGCIPARCIVFEDSPPGVTAGLAAGTRVIGVLTGHTAVQLEGADGYISTFEEIQIQQ